MATGLRKLGWAGKRRCNGFNKVSLLPWWLIDIFWHLLPRSAVIDSSYRPRSRKGWGCGMGAVLIHFYRKEPCLVAAVLWSLETRPCCLGERSPLLAPLTRQGAQGPEPWEWVRIKQHPPKMLDCSFWCLRKPNSHSAFLIAPTMRGWGPQSVGLVWRHGGKGVWRWVSDEMLMGSRLHLCQGMSPTYSAAFCCPGSIMQRWPQDRLWTLWPEFQAQPCHTHSVTLSRLINLSTHWFPHQYSGDDDSTYSPGLRVNVGKDLAC